MNNISIVISYDIIINKDNKKKLKNMKILPKKNHISALSLISSYLHDSN